MTTPLEKPLAREIVLGDQPHKVVISPDGVRLTRRGGRKGTEMKWDAILALSRTGAGRAVAARAGVGRADRDSGRYRQGGAHGPPGRWRARAPCSRTLDQFRPRSSWRLNPIQSTGAPSPARTGTSRPSHGYRGRLDPPRVPDGRHTRQDSEPTAGRRASFPTIGVTPLPDEPRKQLLTGRTHLRTGNHAAGRARLSVRSSPTR
jgi:hypothetical protein